MSGVDIKAARAAQKAEKIANMVDRLQLAGEKQALITRITPNLGQLSMVELRLLAEQVDKEETKEANG